MQIQFIWVIHNWFLKPQIQCYISVSHPVHFVILSQDGLATVSNSWILDSIDQVLLFLSEIVRILLGFLLSRRPICYSFWIHLSYL